MLKQPRLPSAYYPGFFKMDLNLGLENPNPVALALDELLFRISEEAFRTTWKLQPSLISSDRQKTFLENYGFHFSSLSKLEIRELYLKSPEIFKYKGALKGIEILAAIYFGECEIQRGRPYSREHLGEKSRLLLSDSQDFDRIVFVRHPLPQEASRVNEFIYNTRLLLPEGYSLQVVETTRPIVKESAGFTLFESQSLKQRRL